MLKIFNDIEPGTATVPDIAIEALISSDDDESNDSDDDKSTDGLDEICLHSITEPEAFDELEEPAVPELFLKDPSTHYEQPIKTSVVHGDEIVFYKNSHSVKFIANEESYFKMMYMWLKGYRIFVNDYEFVFIGTKVVQFALLDLSFLTDYSRITESSDKTIELLIKNLSQNS